MMKNLRKFSTIFLIVLLVSSALSCFVSAQGDVKPIEANNKIFTDIPVKYELSVFSDTLSYYDEDGNYLEFCVGENKFAPEGITFLNDGQAQKVFEYYYLYDGDLEQLDECFVHYVITEKRKANGYSCYYFQGNYAYSEDNLNDEFAYYFNACIFATKENIFIVSYEDINAETDNYKDLTTCINGIVFNGTCFKGDKPEKNADHDFSGSPDYDVVISTAQENLIDDLFDDTGMVSIIVAAIVLVTIVPTAVLIIIAIVLIAKYNKLKKTLRQCELTYGSIAQYNANMQNYSGYGYNQPINQPYQATAKFPYQQSPMNQNNSQTPSYVTNAVNNLETTQPAQPAQTNLPPEMQENKIENENKL